MIQFGSIDVPSVARNGDRDLTTWAEPHQMVLLSPEDGKPAANSYCWHWKVVGLDVWTSFDVPPGATEDEFRSLVLKAREELIEDVQGKLRAHIAK